MRTTLESGAWIEHTPIQDLKGGHKRALSRAGKARMNIEVDGDGKVDVARAMSGMDFAGIGAATQDALWALLIEKWSYDMPVPELDRASGALEGGDAFDELPLEDFDEIEALFEPFMARLRRKPDPKAKAAATTTASNGSSRASAAHGSPTG
jgi:hypothetical protein